METSESKENPNLSKNLENSKESSAESLELEKESELRR